MDVESSSSLPVRDNKSEGPSNVVIVSISSSTIVVVVVPTADPAPRKLSKSSSPLSLPLPAALPPLKSLSLLYDLSLLHCRTLLLEETMDVDDSDMMIGSISSLLLLVSLSFDALRRQRKHRVFSDYLPGRQKMRGERDDLRRRKERLVFFFNLVSSNFYNRRPFFWIPSSKRFTSSVFTIDSLFHVFFCISIKGSDFLFLDGNKFREFDFRKNQEISLQRFHRLLSKIFIFSPPWTFFEDEWKNIALLSDWNSYKNVLLSRYAVKVMRKRYLGWY